MKFSAILVSVNIAATLPIAASSAAFASEEAKKSTADWLKSNLTSVDPSVNQKNTAIRAGKRSFSKPIDAPPVTSGLKLRPFVAHRRLPSQRDLDMQLIAQTAKMAAQPAQPTLTAQTATMAIGPAPLTGQVSEVYQTLPEQAQANAMSNVATYGSVGYVKQSSSRVVPGQVPSVQGQIRQFKSGKRTRYLPANTGNQPAAAEEAPQGQPQQITLSQQMAMQQQQQLMQQQQMQEQMRLQGQANMQASQPHRWQPCLVPPSQMPAQIQFQPPPLTPDEQAIIDRMVEQVHDGTTSDTGFSGSPMSSAGPAPFPLSLLPQDSLKQLIAGHRNRPDAPAAAYFGSWHGQKLSSLPQAGFQSYSRSAMRPSHTGGGYTHTHGHSQQQHYISHPGVRPTQPQVESNRALGQLRRLPPQDVKPAAYAPYARYSGTIAY